VVLAPVAPQPTGAEKHHPRLALQPSRTHTTLSRPALLTLEGDVFVEGCAPSISALRIPVFSRVKTSISVFDLSTSFCGIAFIELGDKAGLIHIFNVRLKGA
jgi:hypothetical protein